MRKLPILLVALLLSAIAAVAQNPYQVDNFDFANGVRVQRPPVEQAKKSSPAETRKLTSSQNFKYSPAPGALIQLTSQPVNPSLGGFTTGNSEVDGFIVESGKRNSVDPLLLYSIMHQESSFKSRAMSYKGARGLMQLMPQQQRALASEVSGIRNRTLKVAHVICVSFWTCSAAT
jgi:hypothetical protein